MSEKVLIFDTTLRDGEQAAGAAMTAEEKLEIARKLERLNVDIIEAGFPVNSEAELQAVKTITREMLLIKLGRHSRKHVNLVFMYFYLVLTHISCISFVRIVKKS